jgi:putative Mg2+ transporter-C (MgtC) family protein
MDWGTFFDWLVDVVFGRYESVLRLMLAAALGGMIGLEREASGKPAGFRTNLLICMGAALVMELSISVPLAAQGDPGRIAAQIVSGIGFLGAGTILHFRGNVVGLTTAATLWVVAAIGMAVGAQAYIEAIGATLLVMLTLMLLGRMEDHLIPRRPPERLVDVLMAPIPTMVYEIEELIARAGFVVETMKVEKTADAFLVSYQTRGTPKDWDPLLQQLLAHEVVRKVELI